MIIRSILVLLVFFTFSMGLSKFEPNDISILYPRADVDFDKYYVGLDHILTHQKLLSLEQFQFIERHLNSNQKKPGQFAPYEMWKTVSIRLDPCAARKNSNCVPEIRLGVQPYDLKEFQNSAIHLVFEVTKDQIRSLFDQLIDIKEKYNISHPDSISPHKGFSPTKKSGFQLDFERLVFSLLGQDNLFRVGIMISIPGEWFFAGYSVKRNKKNRSISLVSEPFPHGHGEDVQIFSGKGFSTSSSANSKIEFSPNTALVNMIGDIMRNSQLRSSFEAAEKSEQNQTIEEKNLVDRNRTIHRFATDLVSNLRKFNRFNTDCFSCHGASQALKYSEKVHRNNFSSEYPFLQTSWPLQFSAETLPQAMISFGYISYGTPRVSLSDRVRTETQVSLKVIEQWLEFAKK